MPIYDYHCDHCGHAFSVVRSFKDDDVTKCPNCGKHPRRLLSKPAIVFKGSGWYINDSRSGSSSSSDGGTKESADKTEKTTEKKDTAKAESSSTEKPSTTSSG